MGHRSSMVLSKHVQDIEVRTKIFVLQLYVWFILIGIQTLPLVSDGMGGRSQNDECFVSEHPRAESQGSNACQLCFNQDNQEESQVLEEEWWSFLFGKQEIIVYLWIEQWTLCYSMKLRFWDFDLRFWVWKFGLLNIMKYLTVPKVSHI